MRPRTRGLLHWLLALALLVQGVGVATHQASHGPDAHGAHGTSQGSSNPEPATAAGELCLVCASLAHAAFGGHGCEHALPADFGQRCSLLGPSLPIGSPLRHDSLARAPPAALRCEPARAVAA